MASISIALSSIPDSHRIPLIEEFKTISQNFLEKRWSPSELSGGRFSEIVYSIILSIANGTYPASPQKPRNMVEACKRLEQETALSRSFRILIPRILPVLYEIRNNRNVGHVGGDIDPNQMDSNMVLTLSAWVLAEMIRVLHNIDIEEAKNIVDLLTERKIPLIWSDGDIKRVLNNRILKKDQALLLVASCDNAVHIKDLQNWCEYSHPTNFKNIIKKLHSERLIEYTKETQMIALLPPGDKYVSDLIRTLSETA